MNQTPFSKPPPADPLPLEEWLNRTDRTKIGREPFFRGRDKEYDVFRRAVDSLRAGHVGEGSLVFQGAPGAGKSALMQECMEAVRRHSTREDLWVVVSINPDSLRFPDSVVRAIVEAANAETERHWDVLSGSIPDAIEWLYNLGKRILSEIPNRDITVGEVSWSGRERDMSAEGLFRHASKLLKEFHIVVFVDEAQNMPVENATRAVLDCLHRDPQGIPLVAAFFGLSDTQMVLDKCGLSRLPVERLVNLEVLEYEDAASAIRDVFDAYGFEGTSEDQESWVDSLAKLSQGWPQHINRVSVAAARVVQKYKGRIERKYLEEALAQSRKLMEAYYHGRLVGGSSLDWVYRRLALAARENDGVLSWDDIDLLTESARAKKVESTDEFLTNALHAGLLAPVRKSTSRYRIPIPSLGDYLRALPE